MNNTNSPVQISNIIKNIVSTEGIDQSFCLNSRSNMLSWAIAKQISNDLGLEFVDINLSDYSPITLEKLLDFSKNDSSKKYLLYLNDIDHASYSANQIILNLLIDRRINFTSDKLDVLIISSIVNGTDNLNPSVNSHISNRLLTLDVNADGMWKDWSIENGANEELLDSLSQSK